MHLFSTLLFLILTLSTQRAVAAGDVTYPQMESDFEQLGIWENYSEESNQKLIKLIETNLQNEELSKADRLFYDYAKNLLVTNQSEYSYFLSKRIVYSVVAQEHEGRKISLKEATTLAQKFITKIPYQLEGDTFAEITNDHFAWKTLAQVKAEKKSWENIENWANQSVTKILQTKYKNRAINYDLNKVRSVFFLKKMKENATSPKVSVVDAWNIKWKMKWGNEVRSEPVANRLYLNAGGRFQDLIYSYSYQDNLLLILGEKNADTCEEVSSVTVLKKCLSGPPYKFDLGPYIKESGVITENNIDTVLRKLVVTDVANYKKEALFGREFVIFKEGSLEFRDDKIMERGGPIALSTIGATADKFLRSNLLFNIWIDNSDNKDENAKSIILKNFEGKSLEYIEFFHDLGASFGKEALPASLNSFEIGDDFLRKNLTQDSLLYSHLLLYRPKAWKAASANDLFWMANYLNEITVDDLDKSVKASGWPDFAQQVFRYRLQKRLYQILVFYNLKTVAELDAITAPTIKVSLKTMNDIVRFAKLYQVPLKQVVAEMVNYKIYNTNYEDTVVLDGKLSSCEQSFVITFLEKYLYPSGIERRVNRLYDNKPLPVCKFRKG